jgi:hypothetical protein
MRLTQIVLALGLACFAGCAQKEEAPTLPLQQKEATLAEKVEVSSPKCNKAGETEYINRKLTNVVGQISGYILNDKDCCSVRYEMITDGHKIAVCSEVPPSGFNKGKTITLMKESYLVVVSPLFKERKQVEVSSIVARMYNEGRISGDKYTPEPTIPLYELVSLELGGAPTN